MSSFTDKYSNIKPLKAKSTIVNETIIVLGSKFDSSEPNQIPIQMHVAAYELNYGSYIDIRITVDKLCSKDWSDHPLLQAYETYPDECRKQMGDIITDTPAIRALIAELVDTPKALNQRTDCTHKASIIGALQHFWS